MSASNGYKPIADYGVIGNLRTVALIGRDGSIDWCCFPHLDRAGVFNALLDSKRGGAFRVTIAGSSRGEQRYLEDTNVLQTQLASPGGELSITDFMPLSGDIHGCGGSQAPPEIQRLLRCERGEVEVHVEWSPRLRYGGAETEIRGANGGWIARSADDTLALAGVDGATLVQAPHGPEVIARFRMRAGELKALVTRWGSEDTRCDIQSSLEALDVTRGIWSEWAHREGAVAKREWAGEWSSLVTRAALVFKLLCHADTGAIAAAATTSLPETLGGVRNWDYRFAWIRDAALTAQALVAIGHDREAVDLLYWMERAAKECGERKLDLQIMYGVHGEQELPETELTHLEGYRGSKPVRIGNEASEQFQLEIYGEIMAAAYELVRRGKDLDEPIWELLRKAAEHVCGVWRQPDFGIWEVRGEPRHFTYSKVMAWVALDRAVHLAERYGLRGDAATWRRERDEIREQVLEHGYDDEVGAFVISYGSRDLDAANLRIPLLEFLPFDDPRVQGTIDRTLEKLCDNGFVYRYLFDDGLPGKEGAFGLCTFWLIDVLAMSNRVDEARELLAKTASHANHLGLYAEQFDPGTGEFLGNFPQAFTHIGLINSVLYLAYAEGRDVPEHAPVGTPTHKRSLTLFRD